MRCRFSSHQAVKFDDLTRMESVIVPHERAVMDSVIQTWKLDPVSEGFGVKRLLEEIKRQNGDWSLSEKRLKSILKKFNLLPGTESEVTYAKDITSLETPGLILPEKIKLTMTSKRGKGLFAKLNISEGEVIWEEEPLFLVPPLAHVELIRKGNACSFCGQLVRRLRAGVSVLSGEQCKMCPEVWCSKACKSKNQRLHNLMKHEVSKIPLESRKVIPGALVSLLDYSLKEQWNALYAITVITGEIVADESGMKKEKFDALARVSQKTRTRASANGSVSSDSSFLDGQHEQLWEEGHELFLNVFPKLRLVSDYSFENFLFMLGAYNINNLDSSIFLIQSHLNHNCEPNTDVNTGEARSDTLIKVKASRPIRAGEEITTTYVNPTHVLQERREELRVNWGFLCKCKRCKDESKSVSSAAQENRPSERKADTKSVHFS